MSLNDSAAEQMCGIAEVPVILCDEWTPAQVKAFRVVVDRSVSWAAWDDELFEEFYGKGWRSSVRLLIGSYILFVAVAFALIVLQDRPWAKRNPRSSRSRRPSRTKGAFTFRTYQQVRVDTSKTSW
jgi:hypothetical protein